MHAWRLGCKPGLTKTIVGFASLFHLAGNRPNLRQRLAGLAAFYRGLALMALPVNTETHRERDFRDKHLASQRDSVDLARPVGCDLSSEWDRLPLLGDQLKERASDLSGLELQEHAASRHRDRKSVV